MRFFDPKLARKLDDTNDVSAGLKLGVAAALVAELLMSFHLDWPG